ncbi:MAG: hypothetical protein NTX35_07200 [Verrucomicrobia bacterium]|nr:hypothetical protein [Verrucomicrobiota bacterium]
MKPTPPEAEKKLGKDLEDFAQHPAKTKELEKLQDQTDKAADTQPCTRSSETRPSRTRHA